MNDVFVAIDFETADRYRDSACALAMVRVESEKIVKTEHRLIKPPREYFEFTYIHNITWDMVVSEPGFHELWPSMKNILNVLKIYLSLLLTTFCINPIIEPIPYEICNPKVNNSKICKENILNVFFIIKDISTTDA